jgi:hypothetical protein
MLLIPGCFAGRVWFAAMAFSHLDAVDARGTGAHF